jgi:6-phospho-3-hexuloisomerase
MNEGEERSSAQRINFSMRTITEFAGEASKKVIEQETKIKTMINLLMEVYESNRRLFVMGRGRSELVGEAFAMRARHLNFHAHVIGESTTPAVREGDLVVVISGSGQTRTNVTLCEIIINEIGAKIIAITSHLDSPLGRLADLTIDLPGREDAESINDYDKRRLTGKPPSPPMGTLFETIAHIFLDAVISELMLLTGTTEEDMRKRHAIE